MYIEMIIFFFYLNERTTGKDILKDYYQSSSQIDQILVFIRMETTCYAISNYFHDDIYAQNCYITFFSLVYFL